MAPTKKINFKSVANRFAEQYYPQWLSRVDRIWDMFNEVDSMSFISGSKSSANRHGNALGITGGMEPNSKDFMSGIAVIAFTSHYIQDSENLNENDINRQVSIIQSNLNISAGLQTKLENVLTEIMVPLFENSANLIRNTDQKISKADSKDFVVYLARSNGYGTMTFFVDEEELHSQYLSKKIEYDIIIYQHTLEIKSLSVIGDNEEIIFETFKLFPNNLNLLILFLKYKDKQIPRLDLYHCAWDGSPEHYKDPLHTVNMINNVKNGVSSLRDIEDRVNGFSIPPSQRRTETYICRGNFNFCLVLNKSDIQKYTLSIN